MIDVVSSLAASGVCPSINAAGPVTRLGGHRLAAEIVDAMAWAAQEHLPVDELQIWAGERIASATGAEAGYVTSGSAAALVLGVAGAIARLDVGRMAALPMGGGFAREVILQRQHVNSYMRLIRLAGGVPVEVGTVGYPGGGGSLPWQIETAIGSRTCAIVHAAGDFPGEVPLSTVVDIAHRHDLPVIVDAAAAVPPRANMTRFIEDGADLVALSGGKAIGGPQASGLACGRGDLIASIALQHQDMDVQAATWTHRSLLDQGLICGPPQHGLGRPMKVGKEAIVGVMCALDRFMTCDEDAVVDSQFARLKVISEILSDREGVVIYLADRASLLGKYPKLTITFQSSDSASRATKIALSLRALNPPIYLGESELDRGRLVVSASTLNEDEAVVVGEALRLALEAL